MTSTAVSAVIFTSQAAILARVMVSSSSRSATIALFSVMSVWMSAVVLDGQGVDDSSE
ncbi:MAG: hypothetical protein ABSH07_00190 [Candidatus Dormibacteria bacterium]